MLSEKSTPEQPQTSARWRYPSDLDHQEWQRVAPLIAPAKPGGRPRHVNRRDVLDAVLYRAHTRCAWRFLPRDYPAWTTVAGIWRGWKADGTWAKLREALR